MPPSSLRARADHRGKQRLDETDDVVLVVVYLAARLSLPSERWHHGRARDAKARQFVPRPARAMPLPNDVGTAPRPREGEAPSNGACSSPPSPPVCCGGGCCCCCYLLLRHSTHATGRQPLASRFLYCIGMNHGKREL